MADPILLLLDYTLQNDDYLLQTLCPHQEIIFSIIGTPTHNTDVPKRCFPPTIFGHIPLYFDILYEPMSYKSTIANMISSLAIHTIGFQKIHVSLIVI